MLAQSFKSVAELGITEAQLAALQKTLVLLETGRLKHFSPIEEVRSRSTVSFADTSEFSGDFNMSAWNMQHDCGTVCCIGGTAEMVGGLRMYELDDLSDKNSALCALFYPQPSLMSRITPAQAATALRSYLTTGDARWDLAVAS